MNETYYLVDPRDDEGPAGWIWHGPPREYRWLESGLIHHSAEAARQHLHALVLLSKSN